MKKLIIISFFLTVAVGTTIGQPYKSIFGETQTSWNVAFHTMPDWVETDSLVVSSDTLINGQYYKALNGHYWFDGFIREDTVTGKIWYLNSNEADEILVMDLSLNVGDTFIVKPQLYFDSVAIVDSIVYEGGNKILALSSNNNYLSLGTNDHFRFIEGIGPDIGIIFQKYQSTTFGGEGTLLLCAEKDYIQSYINANPDFNGQCNVLYGGITENETENSTISIYPNPSCDKVQIDYKGVLPYSIEIMDCTGKFISSKTDINSSPLNFDMTQYPQGIYLLKVRGNDGKYSTCRVLKF